MTWHREARTRMAAQAEVQHAAAEVHPAQRLLSSAVAAKISTMQHAVAPKVSKRWCAPRRTVSLHHPRSPAPRGRRTLLAGPRSTSSASRAGTFLRGTTPRSETPGMGPARAARGQCRTSPSAAAATARAATRHAAAEAHPAAAKLAAWVAGGRCIGGERRCGSQVSQASLAHSLIARTRLIAPQPSTASTRAARP